MYNSKDSIRFTVAVNLAFIQPWKLPLKWKVFPCAQVGGRGREHHFKLSAGSVSAQSVERDQRVKQSDDSLLQASDGRKISSDARPSPLRFTFLFRHAGRGSVYSLGLEGLKQTGSVTDRFFT